MQGDTEWGGVCSFWLKQRSCKHGNACSFIHHHERLQSSICKYHPKGRCNQGDWCEYKHLLSWPEDDIRKNRAVRAQHRAGVSTGRAQLDPMPAQAPMHLPAQAGMQMNFQANDEFAGQMAMHAPQVAMHAPVPPAPPRPSLQMAMQMAMQVAPPAQSPGVPLDKLASHPIAYAPPGSWMT